MNEEDVEKFAKLIKESKHIQDIEQTDESTQKGKYFFITTKQTIEKQSLK